MSLESWQKDKTDKKDLTKPEKDALFGIDDDLVKTKTPRGDYSQLKPRAIVPLTDFVAELISEFKQPWINETAPWNKNGDDGFLSKVDFMPETANAMDLRTNLTLTSKKYLEWKETSKYKLSESNREGADELINYGFDCIDMHWLLMLFQRPVYTGKEGINYEFEDVDGVNCPVEAHHIDHRRFKPNRLRNPQNGNWEFIWYLQRPEDLEEIPIHDFEGNHFFPNLQVLTYRPWEYSLGWGSGVLNGIYYTWRWKAFVERFSQVGIEKFSLPMIIASIKDDMPLRDDADIEGTKTAEYFDTLETEINKSAAANFIAMPYSLQLDLLDVARDRRLMNLKEWDEYLGKRMMDRILGSKGLIDSERSAGAGKNISQIVQKMMMQDRNFHYRALKWLLERFFELNEKEFAKVGIDSKRKLPKIILVDEDINVEMEIEKVKAASAYKDIYMPTMKAMKDKLGLDLRELTPEEKQSLQGGQPGQEGQGTTENPVGKKMDSTGRLQPTHRTRTPKASKGVGVAND